MIIQHKPKSLIVIGHRGASSYAPENTIAAFEKAFQLGIKWVEFDVQLTRDAIPVLFHDNTITRTSNGQGEIIHHSFNQLQAFDAGIWFNSAYCGERIPKLATVLTFLHTHQMGAILEIKPNMANHPLIIKKILSVIRGNWPNLPDKMVVASFSSGILMELHEKAPDILLGYGIDDWSGISLQEIDRLPLYSLHMNASILDKPSLQWAKQYGRKVYVYTVNDRERARTLVELGIDGIFSDCPDVIQECLT